MCEVTDPGRNVSQYVRCKIDRREYGIDISHVLEIIRPVAVSRVPNAPLHIAGVMNLRGRILPVIDLRKRLGLAPAENNANNRIVIIEKEGDAAGVIVDEVLEVICIPAPLTDAQQGAIEAAAEELADGLVAHENYSLTLLDVAALLHPDASAQSAGELPV